MFQATIIFLRLLLSSLLVFLSTEMLMTLDREWLEMEAGFKVNHPKWPICLPCVEFLPFQIKTT